MSEIADSIIEGESMKKALIAVVATLFATFGVLATATPASAAPQQTTAAAQPLAPHWALYQTWGSSGSITTAVCNIVGERGFQQHRWPAYYCDSGIFTTDLWIWIP